MRAQARLEARVRRRAHSSSSVRRRDLDAGRAHARRLGRVRIEDRIGGVHVEVERCGRGSEASAREAAVGPGDRHVAHRQRVGRAGAQRAQLVLREEGAVDEAHVGGGELGQRSPCRARRAPARRPAARRCARSVRRSPTVVSACGFARSRRKVGTFGASGKKRASSRPSRSSAHAARRARACPSTGSSSRKAASCSQQRAPHPGGREHAVGERLAQQQQPQRDVELGRRQHDGVERQVARAGARVQRRGTRRAAGAGRGRRRAATSAAPSAETASPVCVRGGTRGSPARARTEFAPPQFHCGRPPPAHEPSTRTRTARRLARGYASLASTWSASSTCFVGLSWLLNVWRITPFLSIT